LARFGVLKGRKSIRVRWGLMSTSFAMARTTIAMAQSMRGSDLDNQTVEWVLARPLARFNASRVGSRIHVRPGLERMKFATGRTTIAMAQQTKVSGRGPRTVAWVSAPPSEKSAVSKVRK
jgi:hypothetical protein